MKDLNNKQKIGIILIQDLLSANGLTNKEMAEIMTYCNSENESFSLFKFLTSRWLNDKEISKAVEEHRLEVAR